MYTRQRNCAMWQAVDKCGMVIFSSLSRIRVDEFIHANKDLGMMTLQEIFDKCAAHLLTQGCKSIRNSDDNDNTCAYRGSNDTKCVAVIFISDEHYRLDLENQLVHHRDVYLALINSGFPDHHDSLNLLTSLQAVHDAVEPNAWKDGLKNVTHKFNLSDKVLDSFK